MKNFLFNLTKPTCFLLIVFISWSCSKDYPFPDEPVGQPSVQALDGDGEGGDVNAAVGNPDPPEPTCTIGENTFHVVYDNRQASQFPGYDLVIEIDSSNTMMAQELKDCNCEPAFYQVRFNFPISDVKSGTQSSPGAGALQFSISEYGSHLIGNLSGGQSNVNSGGSPNQHVIKIPRDAGGLVMLKFNDGMPTGVTPQNAVLELNGICIVNDISTPYDTP